MKTPTENSIDADYDDSIPFTHEELKAAGAIIDKPAFKLSSVPLVCGSGKFHTANPNAKHPKPYGGISLVEIEQLLKHPESVEKERGRWCIFSSHISKLSRDHEHQRQNGLYHAVWLDIDVHTEKRAIQDFLALLGVGYYLLYSTRSSTENKQKWRVIIPLCEPVKADLFGMITGVLNDRLEQSNITPDRASERPAQVCYLPNKGDYYDYHINHAELFNWQVLNAEIEAKQHKERLKLEELKRQQEHSRQHAIERMATGTESPIDAYNLSYPIEQNLAYYGYTKRGKKWLSPNSESGQAGVSVKDEKWFSSHGSDSGIGQPTSGGCCGDSFDLFVWYEHNGNRNAAIKAAADMFTTSSGQTLTQANQAAFREQKRKEKTYTTHTPAPPTNPQHDTQSNDGKTDIKPDTQKCEPKQNQTPIVSPAFGVNDSILDHESHYCTVDFLKFVDDKHLLKQLALSVAKATFMPVHTVFLSGLAVFSSVACRQWRVNYQHGGALPIGLYVMSEQPPATSKTWTVSTFQNPFFKIEKEVRDNATDRLKKAQKKLDSIKKGDRQATDEHEYERLEGEINECQRILAARLFFTNATAEAIEQGLSNTKGFFSAVSTEQGLANALLGLCYGADKVSNNDLLLNGFDGGFISTARINRTGYTGDIVGGAVMFAQAGSIENLLKASNGTGLAERFLMLAEPHNLGKRDFLNQDFINPDLLAEYARACNFAFGVMKEPKEFDDLLDLHISPTVWRKINEFRNSIEPHLMDGGRYSHIALRGAAGKINMQIMKIASVLHILDNPSDNIINDDHVITAINIAYSMIEAGYKLCMDKGLIGTKAEYQSILSLFEKSNTPRTLRAIQQAKSQTKPYKDYTGNKYALIKKIVLEMVEKKLLLEIQDDKGVICYRLGQ